MFSWATVVPDSSVGVLSSKRRAEPRLRFGCGGPQINMMVTPSIPRIRPIVANVLEFIFNIVYHYNLGCKLRLPLTDGGMKRCAL
jgi:hypothetical protein